MKFQAVLLHKCAAVESAHARAAMSLGEAGMYRGMRGKMREETQPLQWPSATSAPPGVPQAQRPTHASDLGAALVLCASWSFASL